MHIIGPQDVKKDGNSVELPWKSMVDILFKLQEIVSGSEAWPETRLEGGNAIILLKEPHQTCFNHLLQDLAQAICKRGGPVVLTVLRILAGHSIKLKSS